MLDLNIAVPQYDQQLNNRYLLKVMRKIIANKKLIKNELTVKNKYPLRVLL